MKIHNLPDIRRTTKWKGLKVTTTINGSPKDLSSTVIKCAFKKDGENGRVVKTLTVGAGITKVDALAGIFTLDPFKVDFEAGMYYYDIKFIDDSGADPQIYIGGTWKIEQNVTD